jgi:hypothetical protein
MPLMQRGIVAFVFFQESCQEEEGEQLPRFPRLLTSAVVLASIATARTTGPLLEHSTTRNHVDYPAYSAQPAQHWPEGLTHPRAHGRT